MSGHTASTAVFGGLLAVLLGAAWVQWTAEPAVELDGKVVLLQGDAEDIERIVWKSDGKDEAELERRSDDRGEYLWVTYTRWKPAPKAPDPAEDAATEDGAPEGGEDAEEPVEEPEEAPGEDPAEDPADEPELVAETQVFKSGETGMDLLVDLSPMLALRKLEAEGDKLETIGLVEPTESIEIVRKGRTVKLDVGGEVYGTRDRYVRNQATGEIFLVDDELLRPLKYARTRLPDRTLWAVERADIARITISGTAGSLEVEQENADDADKARWIPAGDAEADDEQLQTWLDKALKLKGSAYAGPEDSAEGLEPRFSLTFTDGAGQSTTLRVTEDPDGTFWGESEHTRGRVKLLRAQTSGLADDVDALTGG